MPSVISKTRYCKKCGLPGIRKGRSYHEECSPYKGHSRQIVKCRDCGKEREIKTSANRPLPKRCRRCDLKSRVGPGNSRWRGGVTPFNQKLRQSERYQKWRNAVFERDNYTCVWCGQHGGSLNADHILPFAKHPRLRFDVSNGRTLCILCHRQTNSYLSKGKKKRRKR